MANQLLKGKKGIIFGALDERSIAWKTALVAVAEGAEIVLTNAPIALRMGKINELAAQCNAQVIGADATSDADLDTLMQKSMEIFGGKVDFILHSIGMSPNVRKNIEFKHEPRKLPEDAGYIGAVAAQGIAGGYEG